MRGRGQLCRQVRRRRLRARQPAGSHWWAREGKQADGGGQGGRGGGLCGIHRPTGGRRVGGAQRGVLWWRRHGPGLASVHGGRVQRSEQRGDVRRGAGACGRVGVGLRRGAQGERGRPLRRGGAPGVFRPPLSRGHVLRQLCDPGRVLLLLQLHNRGRGLRAGLQRGRGERWCRRLRGLRPHGRAAVLLLARDPRLLVEKQHRRRGGRRAGAPVRCREPGQDRAKRRRGRERRRPGVLGRILGVAPWLRGQL